MRDAHRMKEKFDVSLDNRQVVSLLIAGIIVLGAVFVLGVVVGKQLAGNAQSAAAPDLLSALDANAQALQQAREAESPLTFQDELTRKSSPDAAPSKPGTVTVAIPPPAPKPKPVEVPPADVAEPTEDNPPAPSPTDDDYAPSGTAKAPAPKPAETKVAEAKPEPKPAEPKVAEPKPAPKPAETKVADSKPVTTPGKVESAPVATRTTPAAGGMKEAIARAAQRPTEAVPGGAFTLQLSAFQSRPEADRFAAKLRDRGYAPFIVPAEVPGKGTWYRVRMGSFPSKDAASRYLSDFKRETQLQAFVAAAN
ncbi:Translation initiation factor 2 [Cystobacter fuscus DSM 2262]|uniref:Translation initiation factor 2 n=1 Tax=Cystobacter fuscus (strain ATCC 25194 / DSM 2262 / NBRC 100088 / M29) TaxID=1242864 RepID=S9Q4F4_CYSF2|nr:SPOR domain-containing protein [Cystobacter fuscus]EPX56194.1 Translation initiation factor 2 [Cystobacter fuscus DSM 2262]